MSDTAPTEQEPAPPPAKKPKVAKPPEPPWKTFEPAGDSRRERKEPDRLEGGRAPNPVELKRQFEEMREKGDTRPPSEAFKRQKA